MAVARNVDIFFIVDDSNVSLLATGLEQAQKMNIGDDRMIAAIIVIKIFLFTLITSRLYCIVDGRTGIIVFPI